MGVSWRLLEGSEGLGGTVGQLGYLYGTCSLQANNPAGETNFNDKGKMVEVCKRQADGSRNCIVDTHL
jgi:hypothetical protein